MTSSAKERTTMCTIKRLVSLMQMEDSGGGGGGGGSGHAMDSGQGAPYVFQQFIPTMKRKTSGQQTVEQGARRTSSSLPRKPSAGPASSRTGNHPAPRFRSDPPPDPTLPNVSEHTTHQTAPCENGLGLSLNSHHKTAPAGEISGPRYKGPHGDVTTNAAPHHQTASPGRAFPKITAREQGKSIQKAAIPDYVGLRYSDQYRNINRAKPPTQKPAGPKKRISQIDLISMDDSQELQEMVQLLQDTADPDPIRPDPCDPDDLPCMTPEPDWVREYGRDVGRVNPDRYGYKPKHCWCNRCQIMYRMHKDGDPALRMWGNYPCFQW